MITVLRAAAALLVVCPSSIAMAQDAPAAGASGPDPWGEGAPAAVEGNGDVVVAPEAAEGDFDSGDLGDLESLLDERVVTTASRGAERASAAPATVFSITAREMHVYGIRTVDQALAYLGIGVYTMRMRDYTSGIDVGAQGLMLRDSGRHILVLLDGHVMNSQDTGAVVIHEGLGVPLEAIDHLEVMLGAGSVMYGSNAMLAVINVVTRGATRGTTLHAVAELGIAPPMGIDGQPTTPDSPGDRVGLRYRFGAGATSAFEMFGSRAALSIQAEWLEEISNSYRIPILTDENFQYLPGETTYGGAASHNLRAPSVVASLRVGDFTLRIQANHFDQNIPLSGTFSDPRALEERDAARIDLRHEAALTPEVSLSTRLYADYTYFSERTIWTSLYWCPYGQIDGCDFRQSSVGRWAGLEQVLTIDWNLDSNVVTTVGYDVRGRDTTARPADYYDLVTNDAPFDTRLPYVHQVTALGAIFAQQIWRPWEWLTLNIGGRVDIDSLFGAYVSPRAAVVITPTDGASIRASYSEAFRAPTSYELYEADPTFRIAARGLEPEVVRVVELEYQHRLEWLTFGLRLYAAFYENFIETRPVFEQEFDTAFSAGELTRTAELEYVVVYDNLDTLRSFGGTASLTARPVRGLTLAGSVTISDTRRGDELIRLQPMWMGNARIAYELWPDGATFTLGAVFAGRRIGFDDFNALERHEVGEQLDLRATVSSPIEPVPGLRFRASFAYTVNPFIPYVLDAPSESAAVAPVLFQPVTSSLYGFLGLQYDFSL
jgi:outer membrane receptor for ferrienterochelin and colicins